MKLSYRCGVIYLEGLLRGAGILIVALILQAMQVILPSIHRLHVRIHIVIILGVRFGVDLIREGEQAVFLMERTLIVDTSVDGIPTLLGFQEIGVAIELAAILRMSSKTHTIHISSAIGAPKSKRCRNEAKGIYLIACLQATRLEIGTSRGRGLGYDIGRGSPCIISQRATCFSQHFLGITTPRARLLTMVVIVSSAHGELAFLHRTEEIAPYSATGIHVGTDGQRIAFHAPAHGDDVEDAAHALGVILRTWVGDDLYLLDGVGRHTFEHFTRIVAHHVVGLAVHIYLERGTIVHLDVVLSIHRYHRHLAEHLQDIVGLRLRIRLHIIGQLIDVGLYQRLLCHYRHGIEVFRPSRGIQSRGVG